MYISTSVSDLIACLAGELLTYPALLLEIIGQEQEGQEAIRAYLRGELTYSQVIDTIKELV